MGFLLLPGPLVLGHLRGHSISFLPAVFVGSNLLSFVSLVKTGLPRCSLGPNTLLSIWPVVHCKTFVTNEVTAGLR
jgi:hypothetical protein